MLGPQTVISSCNHTFKNDSYRFGEGKCSDVIIKKGVWTGGGTKIMLGVIIGRGIVCTIGPVVVKNVSDWTKVAGVTAKIMGYSK